MLSWRFCLLSLAAAASTVSAVPVSTPRSASTGLHKRQGAPVIYSCTVANTAALSFDDGPYNYMLDINTLLNSKGAKGTFFVNGENWSCIYDQASIDRLTTVYSSGHQIASHTWAHRHLDTLSTAETQSEMARTDEALQRILGVVPAFIRPPYGGFTQVTRDVAAARNQSLVIWDYDSGDSSGRSPDDIRQGYVNLINSKPPSINALNHETFASTVTDVLPFVIDQLKAGGYNLVTVAECLGQQPYLSVGTPQNKTADWHC